VDCGFAGAAFWREVDGNVVGDLAMKVSKLASSWVHSAVAQPVMAGEI